MRLGFVGSMAALLAGTGLVVGQAPEYYAQGGTLPRSAMPAVTAQVAPENGQATQSTGSSGYDCVTCGSSGGLFGGCGAGGCGGGGCGHGGCNSYGSHCDCGHTGFCMYFDAEFLLWNIQRIGLPATTGQPVVGVLGFSNGGFVPVFADVTSDLPGGDSRLGGEHLGSRMTLGFWMGGESHFAMEVSAFVLDRRNSNILASTGAQGISPDVGGVTATVGGEEATFFITSASSSVEGSLSNKMYGFEVNGKCGRYTIGNFCLGTLAGVRTIYFREDLETRTDVSATFVGGGEGGPVPDGVLTMSAVDSFQCANRWYGYQVGGTFEWCCGPCFLNGFAKVGLGGVYQTVDYFGSLSSVAAGGPSLTAAGGSLAGAESVGHHSRTRIAGIAEGSLSIGYKLTDNIRTYLGYDYLYVMRMVRPTNQSALATNETNITVSTTTVDLPPVSTPVFRFNDRDMWVQGVHFGLELRY